MSFGGSRKRLFVWKIDDGWIKETERNTPILKRFDNEKSFDLIWYDIDSTNKFSSFR